MTSKIDIARSIQCAIIENNPNFEPAISGGLCLNTLDITTRPLTDIDLNVYNVDTKKSQTIKKELFKTIERTTGGTIIFKNNFYYKYINFLSGKSLFLLKTENDIFKIDLTYHNNKPFAKLLHYDGLLFENLNLQATCKAIAVNSLTLRRKCHDFTDLYSILNSKYFDKSEIKSILENPRFKRYLRIRSLHRFEWLSVLTAIPFLRLRNPQRYIHSAYNLHGNNFLEAVNTSYEFSKKVLYPALPFIQRNSFSSWLVKMKI